MTVEPTAPRTSTDDRLLRAAQAGDQQAFASLYDAHVGRIFVVCVGLTGDRRRAEELAQDTFVRAWHRLPQFRGESSLATWLHRIAVNALREAERSDRRRRLRVASAADFAADADVGAAVPQRVSPPDDLALRLDLEQAITSLPDGCRTVFVLHDIAGLQHAEIANQLGIAEGTSKAHLFRARRLLRAALER